jgi:hypothetical protein
VIAPRQVCPLCGIEDEVISMPRGAGDEWDFTCTGASGHGEPYSWIVKAESGFDGRSGIMSELGLYEDLPACLRTGDPWVEHGIVEHRYKLLRPDVYFGELLPRYSHVAIGPTRYSTSAFLAQALSHLLREGAVAWQYSNRTGFWTYAHKISYWALPPAPPMEDRYTWATYATDHHLDPMTWDLTDLRV